MSFTIAPGAIRCKARTRKKTQCRFPARLQGYCINCYTRKYCTRRQIKGFHYTRPHNYRERPYAE